MMLDKRKFIRLFYLKIRIRLSRIIIRKSWWIKKIINLCYRRGRDLIIIMIILILMIIIKLIKTYMIFFRMIVSWLIWDNMNLGGVLLLIKGILMKNFTLMKSLKELNNLNKKALICFMMAA